MLPTRETYCRLKQYSPGSRLPCSGLCSSGVPPAVQGASRFRARDRYPRFQRAGLPRHNARLCPSKVAHTCSARSAVFDNRALTNRGPQRQVRVTHLEGRPGREAEGRDEKNNERSGNVDENKEPLPDPPTAGRPATAASLPDLDQGETVRRKA